MASDGPSLFGSSTGRVVANLESDDHKQRLRCRFSLNEPTAGLEGGGHGDCQLSTGEIIENVDVGPM